MKKKWWNFWGTKTEEKRGYFDEVTEWFPSYGNNSRIYVGIFGEQKLIQRKKEDTSMKQQSGSLLIIIAEFMSLLKIVL